MEVEIGPAEADLQRVMEIGERLLAPELDAAPDHRTDLPQPDTELVDHDLRYCCILY
jgi:hypothetical protein